MRAHDTALVGLRLGSNVRVLIDERGRPRRLVYQGHNLVVTAGRNLVRDRLNGSDNALSHIALGTSATAVAASQTALIAEVFRDAVTSTTTGVGLLVKRLYLPTGSGNGNTLREMGLFNAGGGGTMYARVVLATPIIKTSLIAVTFEWDLTFTV